MAGFLSGSESKAVLFGTLPLSIAMGTILAYSRGAPPEPVQLSLIFSVIAWFGVVVLIMLPMTFLHHVLVRFGAGWPVYAIIWALAPMLLMIAFGISAGDISRAEVFRPPYWKAWSLVAASGLGGVIYYRVMLSAAKKGGER
jgi:amino acid transporter